MGSSYSAAIPILGNVKTILQAKKAISWQTGIPLKEIFPIPAVAKEWPKDEDFLDDRQLQHDFEVICR